MPSGDFFTRGTLALVALSFAVTAKALYWGSLAVLGLATLVWCAWGQLLPYVWPTGIRLDSWGVRIGGLWWAERHPGRTRRPLSVNWSSPGFHQPIWVAPTRHPERLRAALARLPLPAGTVSDPYEEAGADLEMPEWSGP